MQADEFENLRPMMFSIAYRMLGSAVEAEDIVQEAYLRYAATPPDQIQSHKAFLGAVVTRLSIDHLRSARSQRETYIGTWLPEPVLTDDDPDSQNPLRRLGDYETISMAFLLLLERLSPLERAVFLLREVFDYEYDEIARIINRSEAACRQVFSRAKKHIYDHHPRFESTPQEHQTLLEGFMEAISNASLERLTGLLADGATLYSDGGGRRGTARRPIHGADKIARFLLGIQRFAPSSYNVTVAGVNGRTGLVVRDAEGTALMVVSLEAAGGLIRTIHIVSNPDKLKRL